MAHIRRLIAHWHPLVRSLRPELRAGVLNRMVYSPEHRFVYFRIPKSANSTIMVNLANLMHGESEPYSGEMKSREARRLSLLLRTPKSLSRRNFVFTFVRNPYSRVLSAYLDKINRPDRKDHFGVEGEVSYRDFLERLDDGLLYGNVHWVPQADLLPLADMTFSKIGKVETLSADLAEISERIFGKAAANMNRESGRTHASSRMSEFYGPQEKRLVEKLYARDFELFYPDHAFA